MIIPPRNLARPTSLAIVSTSFSPLSTIIIIRSLSVNTFMELLYDIVTKSSNSPGEIRLFRRLPYKLMESRKSLRHFVGNPVADGVDCNKYVILNLIYVSVCYFCVKALITWAPPSRISQ